jgi:hypothetical protein
VDGALAELRECLILVGGEHFLSRSDRSALAPRENLDAGTYRSAHLTDQGLGAALLPRDLPLLTGQSRESLVITNPF